MAREKYLYWFRFCYPIDWLNPPNHEIIELFFINAESEEAALRWGNKIVEKFIGDLFGKAGYDSNNPLFISFIWDDWQAIAEQNRAEIDGFPVINDGEDLDRDIENYL